MKIKNQPVVNRTKLYLLPSLRQYGNNYRAALGSVYKIAFGIDDEVNSQEGKNIYILVDTRVKTDNFIKVLYWMKDQPFYVADYEFDDIVDGHLHMLVLHIPNDGVYDNFMLSKYSKMYDYKSLKQYIDENSLILGVLTRDENTAREFVDRLNAEWETSFTIETWTGELDYPWREEEQVFDADVVEGTSDNEGGTILLEGSETTEAAGEG